LHTETGIFIEADPMTVYNFGAATERWPEILPHYRWVHVLDREGNSKLVEMAANRNFRVANWPVRWWAAQTNFPDEPRIKFTHVGGTTKGMEVEWLFTPRENGVEVTIVHDLELKWPIIGGVAANWVIGPLFIDAIAGKTLARVKELAEAGHTPPEGELT
jgi:ribosome-associated toxin RatA of RatAB toxin-antitoxin module